MKSMRAYCAEFIGTFFFVLTVCVAGVLGYAGPYAPIAIGATLMVMVYATGYVSGEANNGNSFYGLAIGFTVTVGAFTVGKISGGAFNPAVAAGLTTIGSVSPLSSGIYYIGDVAGGVIAGLVFDFLNSEKKEPTPVTS